MTACGNQTYCCGADEANGKCSCAGDKGTLTIPDGVFQTAISLSSPIQTQTVTPSSIPTQSQTSTLTGFSTTSTSSSTHKKSPITKNKGVIAGIAIAAVIIISVITGTLVWLWKRPQKSKYISPYADVVEPNMTSPMVGSTTSVRPFKEPENAVIIINGSK